MLVGSEVRRVAIAIAHASVMPESARQFKRTHQAGNRGIESRRFRHCRISEVPDDGQRSTLRRSPAKLLGASASSIGSRVRSVAATGGNHAEDPRFNFLSVRFQRVFARMFSIAVLARYEASVENAHVIRPLLFHSGEGISNAFNLAAVSI